MRTFTQQKEVTVSKLAYVDDKGTYAQQVIGTGYLRPLTESQASANGFQFGQGYNLFVEDEVDIKEGDKLVIESDTYLVQGVARHDRGSEPFKKCLLVKQKA